MDDTIVARLRVRRGRSRTRRKRQPGVYRQPSDSAWTATAFRIDGSIVGRLVVPGGGHPVAFGIGTVVERVTDEDDVVSLVTRRIVPVPAQ